MNWLARLYVDAEIAWKEKILDNYDWHRKLWGCFPGLPHQKRDFLTRIDPLEGKYRLWILSRARPVCPSWCPSDCFDVKQIPESFLSHRYYAFDLKANPVKAKVERDELGNPLLLPNGRRKRGKRVPLVKQEELREWLIRKGMVRCRDPKTGEEIPGGFRIVEEKPLEISPMVENYFRKNEHAAYHGGVQFRGILEVTDQKRFKQTYEAGIGSAKGFGFGLLLLAPVNL